MRYDDGRGPLPPPGIHQQRWRAPTVTARQHPRTQTALYRLFASNGQLLYIGITQDVDMRWRQHAAVAPWWHLQSDATVEWFSSRGAAEEAERLAVPTERPLYNYTYSAPDAGRKAHWSRPPQRQRPARAKTEPPPPWEPTAEQAAALQRVDECAAMVDAGDYTRRRDLLREISAAWALDIPGRELAKHAKRRAPLAADEAP